MVTMSSIIALDQHSNSENFHFLYAVGMSGAGLGMVLLPFLAEVIGQAYGWRGGLLVLGGLMTHMIPCAMAVQVEQPSREKHAMERLPTTDTQEHCSFQDQCRKSFLIVKKDNVSLLGQSCEYKLLHRNLKRNVPPKKSSALSDWKTKGHKALLTTKRILEEIRMGIRRSDFYSDPVINLLYAAGLVNGMMYCGWHAFLVPHVLQRGYSVPNAITINLYASIGNLLGRPLLSTLSGCLKKPTVVYMGAAWLNVCVILCDVLTNQYYIMAGTACLTTMSIAGMTVLGPLAVRERASPDVFDVAYAVHELFFGLGTFLGCYLSGKVCVKF